MKNAIRKVRSFEEYQKAFLPEDSLQRNESSTPAELGARFARESGDLVRQALKRNDDSVVARRENRK